MSSWSSRSLSVGLPRTCKTPRAVGDHHSDGVAVRDNLVELVLVLDTLEFGVESGLCFVLAKDIV